MALALPPLPLLTADLPGVGGTIKQQPEDFEVEEIPAYEPSGSGDHLYLWVEKRDLGAEYFLRQIARRLGIGNGEVGSAGLKDRRAVTRQWISVPAACDPAALDGDGIRVLSVSRHGNKLRPGHLRGNRFRVRIRGVGAERLPDIEAILTRIREQGMPNYYGSQRFGHDGETVSLGLALLGHPAAGANRRPPRNPFLRKLALSAVQSLLFNEVLADRLRDGHYRSVLAGDAMVRWPFGGMFSVADVAVEQERFDRREIVHAGPMFGRKTFPVHAEAAERAAAVLARWQMTRETFQGFGKLLEGTRRANLIYIDDLHAEADAEGVGLTFTLPAGSYATVLLREVMKSDAAERGDEGEPADPPE